MLQSVDRKNVYSSIKMVSLCVSGTTLTQFYFGQYTNVWSSVGRYIHSKQSQQALVRRMTDLSILYMATCSPSSSHIALMASRRLILYAKKIKC